MRGVGPDRHPAARRRAQCCRRRVERPGPGGDPAHPVEVDVRFDAPRDPIYPSAVRRALGGRDEAEMRSVERELGRAADRSEHGQVRIVLHRAHELRLMALAADPVQDDSGDPHAGVEVAVAAKQRCDPPRDPPRIHHEHDGRREQLREGGVAVRAIGRHPVMQPLVPLDEGQIRAGGAPCELRQDLGVPHRVEVEVVAVAARRRGQPQGIDVVRPLLERLHGKPAPAQGGGDAHRHRGLPGRLVGGGDEDTRHRVHPGSLADLARSSHPVPSDRIGSAAPAA